MCSQTLVPTLPGLWLCRVRGRTASRTTLRVSLFVGMLRDHRSQQASNPSGASGVMSHKARCRRHLLLRRGPLVLRKHSFISMVACREWWACMGAMHQALRSCSSCVHAWELCSTKAFACRLRRLPLLIRPCSCDGAAWRLWRDCVHSSSSELSRLAQVLQLTPFSQAVSSAPPDKLWHLMFGMVGVLRGLAGAGGPVLNLVP